MSARLTGCHPRRGRITVVTRAVASLAVGSSEGGVSVGTGSVSRADAFGIRCSGVGGAFLLASGERRGHFRQGGFEKRQDRVVRKRLVLREHVARDVNLVRSEEHTSELQSLR